MSDEAKHEDGLMELKDSLQSVDAVMKSVISPQLQHMANTMQAMSNAVVTAFQSEAMAKAINIGNYISELVSSVDFSSLLKSFNEASIPYNYITLLERLKWPVFLIDDEELRERIMSVCEQQDNVNAVRDIIFNYCSDSFLEAMEDDWNNCVAIADARKPILSEAMHLHKNACYYGSTSMLMCQVYGVASDIVDIAKKNDLKLDDEAKDFVSEYFKIKREDVDKEKGKLMQMVIMTESGQLLWDAMANYLKEEILCSSDSKQRWATQPLRNKICHGDQLNFGTKEHSIKAILTIDMLIQLAYEIHRIAELRDNSTKESEAEKNGAV